MRVTSSVDAFGEDFERRLERIANWEPKAPTPDRAVTFKNPGIFGNGYILTHDNIISGLKMAFLTTLRVGGVKAIWRNRLTASE